jgi:hypothetical protein
MVDQPGSNWALGFEYLLAGGRAGIVYKGILSENTIFTPRIRQVIALYRTFILFAFGR